jgi:hypothetical protein
MSQPHELHLGIDPGGLAQRGHSRRETPDNCSSFEVCYSRLINIMILFSQ